MSLISKYNKSQINTNAVSDTLKNQSKYSNKVVDKGSEVVKQADNPNKLTILGKNKLSTNYTQEVFQDSLN